MCRDCGFRFSRVIATERYDDWTRRRRKCRQCGAEYYTKEEYNGAIKPPQIPHPSAAENGNQTRLF